MTPRAVLVGLPGTGKSTTGRRLAKMLGVAFADSDDLVESTTGRGVRVIFAEDGESEFRRHEAAAIAAALVDFDGVLALGGGALTTEATRSAITASGTPVVLLLAPIPTLTARVGDARTRPLLTDAPEQRLMELAAQRDPIYRALATLSVETADRTPGQVAAAIAARLHERSRA
jgi:shikimate kinase